MTSNSSYQRATQETIESLHLASQSLSLQRLTKLSLPEIEAVMDLVGKVIPAGNVPGMILSGLTRISGNQVQPQKARQDINILFKEVNFLFEHAKYGAFFIGPAAIIWGYQNLLKLAGKDPESAFPEGVWQFYVDYALREDTARHTSETHGFDTLLSQNQIQLSEVDRLTAWVMAAVTCLHQYQRLLKNEWYERTMLWSLREAGGAIDLDREWEKHKPYTRTAEAAEYDYPAYREFKFKQFLDNVAAAWPSEGSLDHEALAAYQKQLSIRAYLDPNPFGETRVPIALEQVHVGIIHQGRYDLLPVCEPDTSKPLDVRSARSQIARLLTEPPRASTGLQALAQIKRAELATIRKKLSQDVREDLEKLRLAPILINTDRQNPATTLSQIRQGERGIGDHALTIFDTGKTFVFDQSHIFFDGTWGAALAEIMTNEALSWAVYLNMLSPAASAETQSYSALRFNLALDDLQMIQSAPRVSAEVDAENNQLNVRACLDLRKYFKQRSEDLNLTINDLLVLYRAIHAVTYRPSAKLRVEVETLEKSDRAVANVLKQALKESLQTNPSILIPVDASKHFPRDRIYPLNLEVPLAELDLLQLHQQALASLAEYESHPDSQTYKQLDSFQRRYLATLGGFGTILTKAKSIAVQGESASVGAIKLLAYMPLPVKQLLDKVPARYEKLNNLLKGTEVLSNLGAVATSSSLTRFITAKDDNEQKQLTWGVLTDARGSMVITLRDFRPHVAVLHQIQRSDLARQITQDYLDAYVQGCNQFVHEIIQIAIARPRDQMDRKAK